MENEAWRVDLAGQIDGPGLDRVEPALKDILGQCALFIRNN
jgi:hypothetical protein